MDGSDLRGQALRDPANLHDDEEVHVYLQSEGKETYSGYVTQVALTKRVQAQVMSNARLHKCNLRELVIAFKVN